MFCYFFFFFFFSSRRRHTRCSRDWSSDVCSSDLEPLAEQCFERGNGELRRSEKDHAHSELARRLRRHVFHVPGLPLARLLPLGEEQSPFHRAQVDEEEQPIQVAALVLPRPRLEAGELAL